MKIKYITAIILMFSSLIAGAVSIGYYPGLSKLIEKADAIVVLRVERLLSEFNRPTFYSTHESFIYQTLKGDIPKNSRIKLQLHNLGGNFASPYPHGSTHLIFLAKKENENEPTDYRMITIKGAQTLLSPFGHEKEPEGETIEEKVQKALRERL